MKTKTSLLAIATATILLTSGFGISSAYAQTNNTTKIIHVVPSTLNNHSVIFQICAYDYTMRAPEAIITSDSQVKNVKLNKAIAANTCKVSATTIKAFDKDSIKLKKVDKAKINLMISEAEKRLTNIKSKISDKNAELEVTLESLPGGNNALKPEKVKTLNKISTELSELRKELKDARGEYYRLLYVIRG